VIVLDTNVVSELMKKSAAPQVVRWVTSHPDSHLFTTSVTRAEVLRGIAELPQGKRRDLLAAAAEATFDSDFSERILPFGSDAAKCYASIVAERRRIGRPVSVFDAQIAAIVRAHGASLAMRNIDVFAGCGLDVVNPWQPPTP